MSFAYARAQRDAYLLFRMEAEELGQRLKLDNAAADGEPELEPEHRHGEGCACNLRGE